MLRRITRKIKKLANRESFQRKGDHVVEDHPLSTCFEQNVKQLKDIFEDCTDVVFREFTTGGRCPVRVLLLYVDGLTNSILLSEGLMTNIMIRSLSLERAEPLEAENAFQVIKERLLAISEVTETGQINQLVDQVLSGSSALLVDGSAKALIVSAKGWESRAVNEPESETVVRGPRDGFVENLRVNTAHLRRRIRTSRLKMERMRIGLLTKTDVLIVYIKGIANDKVIDEVKQRLSRINTDSILESGYIAELIEDEPFSLFAQINATERPDKVAAGLLEGQVAIMVDNTPFVLLVPITFIQLLQASEDYYNRYPWATFVRLLRFVALNIALLLPSLYVAVTTYHQEMIPTPLLISIAGAREAVPFPAFVEAVIMETIFEILREAGVRLPRAVGQAVSIVGALVIGEAAVSAGLVSPAMVIVVALTAIASFTFPSLESAIAIRLIRFPMIFLAGALGLFGIIVGLLAILIHLCTLRSFGVPYLSPLAPMSLRDLKDSFIRFPWWAMFTRPRLTGYKEPARQDYLQKPQPPPPRKGPKGEGGGEDA